MKTVSLPQVLKMLVNEEHEEATGLLREWLVAATKRVYEEQMAEDNTLSQDIEDDQEAIQSEEFYSEAAGDDEDEEVIDADVDGDVDVDADVDVDVDSDLGDEEEVTFAELGDTVDELEDTFARLKAQFAELTGADVDGDGEDEEVEFSSDEVVDDAGSDDESEVADEVEFTESVDEDFEDLEESWKLEVVKDPRMEGDREIGSDYKKFHVNDKSPLPENDADDRVGGTPVVIHSEDYDGHDLQPSPEVKARPLLRNQVKKATDGRSKVSKEGDKSAMLNSKQGFGSDSPKSPIGQATDLRGNDFKRK